MFEISKVQEDISVCRGMRKGQGGRGSQSFRSPRTRLLETGLQEHIFARGCDLWRALAPPRRSAMAFALLET